MLGNGVDWPAVDVTKIGVTEFCYMYPPFNDQLGVCRACKWVKEGEWPLCHTV